MTVNLVNGTSAATDDLEISQIDTGADTVNLLVTSVVNETIGVLSVEQAEVLNLTVNGLGLTASTCLLYTSPSPRDS